MVDGPTEARDLDKTESNRSLVRSFVESVLVGGLLSQLNAYIDDAFAEHNPNLRDGVSPLRSASLATYEGVRKVVEHWDTTEKIAPRSEWKNDNGKF